MEIRKHLQQLHEEGNYREIPTVTPLTVAVYCTNDYMGLAADATLQAKFFADPISATVPLTSSAARLLAPRQIEYTNLEVFLSTAGTMPIPDSFPPSQTATHLS